MGKFYRIFGIFVLFLLCFHPGITGEPVPESFAEGWVLSGYLMGSEGEPMVFLDAIALDLDSEGNIYVIDRGRHRLLKFSPGGILRKEIGGYGDGPEQFDDPHDVDAHLTLNVFVADYNNNRIVRFDANLNYLNEFRTNYEDAYHFEMPLSVAVSGQYDVFVLEDLNKRVIKFDRFNQPQTAFGDATENLGQLLAPHQITIGQDGRVFVSDPAQKAVVVFDYLGNFLEKIVHPDLRQPGGIYSSGDGELLIADNEGEGIYFFREGRKFSGRLDLTGQGIRPVDAALGYSGGKKQAVLYILTTGKCFIFRRTVH